MLPTIAAQRPNSSSVLIEDIAINILDLPNLISDIKKLFVKYNFTNAAIFGHILAGNIHFVLTLILMIKTSLLSMINLCMSLL